MKTSLGPSLLSKCPEVSMAAGHGEVNRYYCCLFYYYYQGVASDESQSREPCPHVAARKG